MCPISLLEIDSVPVGQLTWPQAQAVAVGDSRVEIVA